MEQQEPSSPPTTPTTPAERCYQSHLKQVSLYQKRNPEKMREKCKRYMTNLKETNSAKYEEILQQKRDYYHNVVKPKKLKKMEDKKNDCIS